MTERERIRDTLSAGKACLGLELGSTRIKAVLMDQNHCPIIGSSHVWESRFENGFWTYSMDDVWLGIQSVFRALQADVRACCDTGLPFPEAMGVSAMMHGYLAFDKDWNLLVPFRTWQNTCTGPAAAELTELFGFNIPQRWSIAHLYQAVLNKEELIPKIAHITTLAGYIHFLLTGNRIVGVGEASGMFPISGGGYDTDMLNKFDKLASENGFEKNIRDVLPQVKNAGEYSGIITAEGAKFLDPDGDLKSGIPLCPPEGDAGTGMAATNAVLPKTGNISAGTSVFSMLVLEKPLSGVYPEIDIVATPDGAPVAMLHCNNCCSELDAWVNIFEEFSVLSGNKIDKSELYEMLYKNALNGDTDCGGVAAYNFLSGEPVAGVAEGRPMYFRTPDSKMNLANFFRAELYSAFAALKIGMDILFEKEKVSAEQFTGHGGIFKVQGVAQQFLADGLNTPVSVMKTAGEGGAWGMALLAAYMICKNGKSLAEWLDSNVFADMDKNTAVPEESGVKGFAEYIKRYKAGLAAEIKPEGI